MSSLTTPARCLLREPNATLGPEAHNPPGGVCGWAVLGDRHQTRRLRRRARILPSSSHSPGSTQRLLLPSQQTSVRDTQGGKMWLETTRAPRGAERWLGICMYRPKHFPLSSPDLGRPLGQDAQKSQTPPRPNITCTGRSASRCRYLLTPFHARGPQGHPHPAERDARTANSAAGPEP